MNEFVGMFVEEARNYIKKLECDLDKLKIDLDDRNIIDDIFRIIHTLKGMSGMVEQNSMYEYLHNFEDILEDIKCNRSDMNLNVLNKMIEVKETLGFMVNEIEKNIVDDDVKSDTISLNIISSKINKIVENLKLKTNKKVKIKFSSNLKDIKKDLATKVMEILVHLIRNSVDHGIENIEDRVKNGKDECGNVEVSLVKNGNYIVISVSDDGFGVDFNKIKKKAVDNKLVAVDKIDKLNEKELMNLLFVSGFSTTDKVSDISGRGVGLDVVKKIVSDLKGDINIYTSFNKGTIVNIVI